MTAGLDDPESAEVIADERAFERAEEFDVWRAPRRHLAFGHGLHFCIGAALARLEASVALDTLLDLDLTDDLEAAVRIPSSLFRGYECLPAQVRTRSPR